LKEDHRLWGEIYKRERRQEREVVSKYSEACEKRKKKGGVPVSGSFPSAVIGGGKVLRQMQQKQ